MMTRTFSTAVAAFCIWLFASATALAQAPAAAGAPPPPAAPTQSTPSAESVGPPVEGASSAYVLGRDDVVQVGVLGRSDFGGRVRVQADGTIQLQFVGKIEAAEHTTADVAESVRKALKSGGYFADPVVTVEVVGYASRYVTILGAVGSPGLLPINRPYRLSEILAKVGGVRGDAAEYLIVRSEKGDEKKYAIRDLAVGDLNQDPYVAPGDKIYAPPAETFYIYGKVNAPGVYNIQDGMTFRQAIARGGGLAESGSDKKLTVTRGGKKVKVDLGEKVQGGDVVVVGERLF